MRLWNLLAPLCCRKRRRLQALHWQPSVVPCCMAPGCVLAGDKLRGACAGPHDLDGLLLQLLLQLIHLHVARLQKPLKSLWRYEVSRTDSIEKEMIYPPNERDEVLAAESETPLDFHRILQCLGGFGGPKGLGRPRFYSL